MGAKAKFQSKSLLLLETRGVFPEKEMSLPTVSDSVGSETQEKRKSASWWQRECEPDPARKLVLSVESSETEIVGAPPKVKKQTSAMDL